ncbi:hypothetical protein [uncultured Methylibium sp.]|uniref:hypothetical protein n=1 Tax=uncultured Methylibium sp. TaxID=381093 RepID=UPI0025D8FD33|nr:hypothetical protein [uncultured Methylibium sp.]
MEMFMESSPRDGSSDASTGGKRIASVYRCKMRFDTLEPTDYLDIRYCHRCQQRVFQVAGADGFVQAVAAKGCVWGPVEAGKAAEENPARFWLSQPLVERRASDAVLRWHELDQEP